MATLLLAFALVGQAESVEFRLLPNATKIQVYDYLLIKAMVVNYGEKPAPAPKPIGLYFDQRVRGRSDWTEFHRPGEPIPVPNDLFPPGFISVSYRHLIGDGTKQGFYFPKPGKYELRARIKGNERELVSSSLFIEVEDRPAHEIDLITDSVKPLYFLEYRDLSQDDVISRLAPLQVLKEGTIRQSVDRMVRTADYLKSGAIEGKKLSPSAAFPLLVKDMNNVERDFVLFHLCADCENQKDWKELAKLRRFLLEQSDIRDQIDVRLRYYGLMKPVPRNDEPK